MFIQDQVVRWEELALHGCQTDVTRTFLTIYKNLLDIALQSERLARYSHRSLEGFPLNIHVRNPLWPPSMVEAFLAIYLSSGVEDPP